MQIRVRHIFPLFLFAAVGVLTACTTADTREARTQELRDAEATLANFQNDPEMTWFKQNYPNARAIVISPRVTRGGFIVGGSGGQAVAYVRDAKSGQWVGPAFYNMGSASVGFLAGVDVSEIVVLAMTQKAVDGLLSNSFKFGGDASISAGPVGAGAGSTVTSDMVSFARSKGVYAGLSLDGAVISPDSEANAAYYGKPASAADILVRRSVADRGPNTLSKMLAGKCDQASRTC